MTRKQQTRTERILLVMKVLAWVAFVGFLVEAGAMIVSYAVSCINPEAAKKMYKGFGLYTLYHYDFIYYTSYVSLVITIILLKAYVCYLIIKNLSSLTLADPFKMEVARTLERVSYILLCTWIMAVISKGYAAWLFKKSGQVFENIATEELIFMAGLVFIISQIFKRGVEIQSENELTV